MRHTAFSAVAVTALENGQLTPFSTELIAFAARQPSAGAQLEVHVRPGMLHRFYFVAPDAAVTVQSVADRGRLIRAG